MQQFLAYSNLLCINCEHQRVIMEYNVILTDIIIVIIIAGLC